MHYAESFTLPRTRIQFFLNVLHRQNPVYGADSSHPSPAGFFRKYQWLCCLRVLRMFQKLPQNLIHGKHLIKFTEQYQRRSWMAEHVRKYLKIPVPPAIKILITRPGNRMTGNHQKRVCSPKGRYKGIRPARTGWFQGVKSYGTMVLQVDL